MATADSVKAKLQGLIAKANEVTGNTDADLTTAIDALLAGFGQGGVPFAKGSFTIAQVILQTVITHNLKSTKVFVVYSVRDNPAVYTRRYQAVMGFAMSNGAYPTRVVDVSSYSTAGITEVIMGPGHEKNMTHVDVISPYTTDYYSNTGMYYIVNNDPNTFTLRTREGFRPGLTYDWVAVDISDIIPWSEEVTE